MHICIAIRDGYIKMAAIHGHVIRLPYILAS